MYTNGVRNNNATPSLASGSNPAANAALQGATKAFGKPQVKPKPEVKPKPLAVRLPHKEPGQDGALSAANLSWRSQSPSPTLKPGVQSQRTPALRGALLPPPVLTPKPTTPAKPTIIEPRSQSLPPSSPDSSVSAATRLVSQAPTDRKPLLPPPRRTGTGVGSVGNMGAANTAAVLASSRRPSHSDLAAKARSDSVTGPLPTSRRVEKYQDQSLRMLEPHVTGDTLSNAIVGANLAVTHNPSRQPTPQPHKARQPSPPKQLRESMRKYSSESSSDSDGRRFKIRRHPHKHHEGDRKRWRERVTDEEYKRYASLWASNRGLWLTHPCPPLPVNVDKAQDEEICNLVAKDLWQRSKLPDNVLSIIWDLVDSRKLGRLTKNEFIVGMYLIDQKLRGNKLPHRVADSTWESVMRWSATGVKIRIT